jgi:hypothetical protein
VKARLGAMPANCRLVVVLGRAEPVLDDAEKDRVLRLLVEHIVPGRTADARGPDAKELAATAVLGLKLDEASAKIRNGPPLDDEEDYELPVWAGVLPLGTAVGEPAPTTVRTTRRRPLRRTSPPRAATGSPGRGGRPRACPDASPRVRQPFRGSQVVSRTQSQGNLYSSAGSYG